MTSELLSNGLGSIIPSETVCAIILFLLGLIVLIKGGDWFVDGAVGIAHKFRLPEILIGATIVSIGTTLPEVVVSATSAIKGSGDIAYGNAIGSIICNTALISAVTITIKPSAVDKKALKLPVISFFIAAITYLGFAYFAGGFGRVAGTLFVTLFTVYMVLNILSVKRLPKPDTDEENTVSSRDTLKFAVLLVVGAVLIKIGSDLLVDNGIFLAAKFGVPESVIGLTIVALGTSLPELVTAITSLIKGHGALSLGNIIGANLFDLILVSGIAPLISPFNIPSNATVFGVNSTLIIDLPVMLAVMAILTLPALLKGKLSRLQGITLLCIYVAFCTVQFII